jgi:hypothetical protein
MVQNMKENSKKIKLKATVYIQLIKIGIYYFADGSNYEGEF